MLSNQSSLSPHSPFLWRQSLQNDNLVDVGACVVGWVDKEVDEMIGRAGAELTPEKYNFEPWVSMTNQGKFSTKRYVSVLKIFPWSVNRNILPTNTFLCEA